MVSRMFSIKGFSLVFSTVFVIAVILEIIDWVPTLFHNNTHILLLIIVVQMLVLIIQMGISIVFLHGIEIKQKYEE